MARPKTYSNRKEKGRRSVDSAGGTEDEDEENNREEEEEEEDEEEDARPSKKKRSKVNGNKNGLNEVGSLPFFQMALAHILIDLRSFRLSNDTPTISFGSLSLRNLIKGL